MSSTRGISGAGRAELALVAGRRRFVGPEDVQRELALDRKVATRKLANWAERGWLRRVRRGLYIRVPVEAERPSGWAEDPLVVGAEVWRPCYFTGWTAANRWGLTEQVFRTVVLKSTQRVRHSTVRLLDVEYLVIHAAAELLDWGLTSVWQEETRLLFADPARVVIDALDMPSIAGGVRSTAVILGTYLDEQDPELLVTYGDRLGNRTVFKRLGYLTEVLGREEPQLISACRARVSEGVALLEPGRPVTGPRIGRWGLRANVHVAPESPS